MGVILEILMIHIKLFPGCGLEGLTERKRNSGYPLDQIPGELITLGSSHFSIQ